LLREAAFKGFYMSFFKLHSSSQNPKRSERELYETAAQRGL
jgi:hypothetical protein